MRQAKVNLMRTHPPYSPLVVVSLIVLTILGVAFYRPFSYAAYFECCSPPSYHSSAGRFQQNAQVTVYIPNNSGLTAEEIDAIEVAMEDWNDEGNNSNVQYNVVEGDPPGEQTNNTIVVNFVNSNNPNIGGGSLTVMDQRTNEGEVDGLCTPTPILIDVLGNGFELTGLARGVKFDLDLDGVAEPIAWTSVGSDDAFLVLDRDGNGRIDDGSELFGDITPQPEPPAGENKNGFLALAEFDKAATGGNGDGIISEHDSIFLSLRLWQDTNHNSVSEQSELHQVEDLGLETIELSYKPSKRTDEHGNKFKYRAKVKDNKDAQMGRWAWDVILLREQ